MKYYMQNEYWPDGEVIVDIKKTVKAITITPLSPKPKFTPGAIDVLWDDGKIVIREPAPGTHKISRHGLKDWGDGEYTLYPNREGIPFYLVPVKGQNASG